MKIFISYSYKERRDLNTGSLAVVGMGNIDVEVKGKVKSLEDVRKIESCIAESTGVATVAIINWKYFAD